VLGTIGVDDFFNHGSIKFRVDLDLDRIKQKHLCALEPPFTEIHVFGGTFERHFVEPIGDDGVSPIPIALAIKNLGGRGPPMAIGTELLHEDIAIWAHPLATRSDSFQDTFHVACRNAVDKLRGPRHSQPVDVRGPVLGKIELGLAYCRLTVSGPSFRHIRGNFVHGSTRNISERARLIPHT